MHFGFRYVRALDLIQALSLETRHKPAYPQLHVAGARTQLHYLAALQ